MATTITKSDTGLHVPDEPIIPYIEGDGIGPDIWAAAQYVFDAAVHRAYGGDRRIASTVSSGSHSPPASNAFWPASTSVHAMRRSPP